MKKIGIMLLILVGLANLTYAMQSPYQDSQHIPSSASQDDASAASNTQANGQYADVDSKSSKATNNKKTGKAGPPIAWDN